MQRVLRHAWLDQPFCLQLLLEATLDGFIQLAPFALCIRADCKRIGRKLIARALRVLQLKSCARS